MVLVAAGFSLRNTINNMSETQAKACGYREYQKIKISMLSKKNKICCLMGPTAAGKTELAIELTKIFPLDIVSVDSGMIYHDMDIGTAKPTLEQLKIAPHRLINICDPVETYSAGQFRQDALIEIEKIFANERIPLLVGGTMLYFKILQQGISDLPKSNKEIRAIITAQREKLGLAKLYQQLQKIDPQTAAAINSTDSQRIQRALEVFELTGKSLSELKLASPPEKLPYKFINIAIAPTKLSELHNKINQRLQKMLNLGLIEEAKRLYQRKDLHADLPSMRLVGYRELWQYFSGKINYEQLLEQISIATRQLAKRQMTWLKSWPDLQRFNCQDTNLFNNVIKYIKSCCQN